MMNKVKKKKDTFEQDWKQWQDVMNSLPVEIRANCRSAGAYSIIKSGMLPDGCGISSSDINHELFGIWKSCGKELPSFLVEMVELLNSRSRMEELIS